jgi:murein DD-endopeptidase MepM/ murein hydrolase activator NlpD
MRKKSLIRILKKYHSDFAAVIPGLRKQDLMPLDLSDPSDLLNGIDIKDTRKFHNYLFDEVLRGKAGIGGFFENRAIYRRSTHYDGEEARSLHLGLDIWMPAGTPLHSPLEGTLHSLQDNRGFGNYGPTIITEHQLEGQTFFLLYGHLDGDSLKLGQPGGQIEQGQLIGRIGDFPENGDWPPHLHWQMMTDMLGNRGDFPGVAAPSERDYYLQFCVNPEYILKLES